MDAYIHGAYGIPQASTDRAADAAASQAVVLVGTAPVHTVAGGAANVNKPVLVNTIAEARAKFGYSADWAKYTLCEAMHVFLEQQGIGPLVLINVLNPATHKSSTAGSVSKTPENGRITLTGAGDIALDSVSVTDKVKGTDYAVSYDWRTEVITIAELTAGALGTAALTVTYDNITPSAVTGADVIGASDGLGLNTGLYAVKNVYQVTGLIPSYLLAPGFSSVKAVHDAMATVSRKINDHWDAWLFTDIPISDGGTAITLNTVAAWKANNGYNLENETVSFPMVTGTDGAHYHLSVLRAANFLRLLGEYDGVPYHTASNTDLEIAQNLWFGADNEGLVYDDALINDKLCKFGICSAAFVGGRWAIWGAHAASYTQATATNSNVAETAVMMLYYLSNDFQHRHMRDVDLPLTSNDIQSIVADEQAILDALVQSGALSYGAASINADAIDKSDVYSGDYAFALEITPVPLAKSLTAYVSCVDDGYAIWFETAAV